MDKLSPGKAIRILRSLVVQFEFSLPDDNDSAWVPPDATMIDNATKEAEQDNLEAIEALNMAIEAIRATAKCERCHKAKAVEFSSSTDACYCRRCYKAVTDPKTPY